MIIEENRSDKSCDDKTGIGKPQARLKTNPHRVTLGGTQKDDLPKGGFGGCSPGTNTGTRVRSDVPPEQKIGTRVRSHVPPERKPERGHIRQNHPFTKLPFYLPVTHMRFFKYLDVRDVVGVG